MEEEVKKTSKLWQRIDKSIERVENLHLEEYIIYRSNKKRMFWENFLYGLARGLGYAVGFTILGALLIMVLRGAAKANLPVIGNVIAEIVKIVNAKLQ